MEFKIKFRGVRGTHPTPKASHLRYGGNTSCVEINVAGRLIILDAGTGIVELGENLTRDYILSKATGNSESIDATIILSHIHQDHIQGLPFFSPLFLKDSNIKIYGADTNKEPLKNTLSSLLFEKSFPVCLEDLQANVSINSYNQNKAIIIDKNNVHNVVDISQLEKVKKTDDIIITSYKTAAHPKNGCLCIKIEYGGKSLVYATDKECYVGSDKKFVEFANKCTCLIHDAQYTHQDYISPVMPKQGFGHSTFNMAIETAKLAKTKKLYFFHYDPGYDDNILDMIHNDFQNMTVDFNFSKENLEIDL